MKLLPQVYAQVNEIYNPALDSTVGARSGATALAILIANLWRALIVLGGVALIIYLVWGGIQWVMAGGDSGKLESAKARITQSIIGMAVLAASVAIAIFLSGVLKIDLLNPTFYGPGDAGYDPSTDFIFFRPAEH